MHVNVHHEDILLECNIGYTLLCFHSVLPEDLVLASEYANREVMFMEIRSNRYTLLILSSLPKLYLAVHMSSSGLFHLT